MCWLPCEYWQCLGASGRFGENIPPARTLSERMMNRRREARRSAEIGLLTIYRITRLGNREKIGTSIAEDISAAGIGIRLDKPPEVGEILVLSAKGFEKHGIVRNTRQLQVGHRVGLRFCAAPPHDKEAEANRGGNVIGRPGIIRRY